MSNNIYLKHFCDTDSHMAGAPAMQFFFKGSTLLAPIPRCGMPDLYHILGNLIIKYPHQCFSCSCKQSGLENYKVTNNVFRQHQPQNSSIKAEVNLHPTQLFFSFKLDRNTKQTKQYFFNLCLEHLHINLETKSIIETLK